MEMVFHFCFSSTPVCDLMDWALQWAMNLSYGEVWVKGGERTVKFGQISLISHEVGHRNGILCRPVDDGMKVLPSKDCRIFSLCQ